MPVKKKKIALVVLSLARGGMEKSSALLAKILNYSGYEVTIISVLNAIDFEYDGQYISLESDKSLKNKPIKRKWLKYKKAKKIFRKNNFDLIIDSRTRPLFIREFIIQKLLYKKTPVIYLVHSYFLELFFNSKILSQLLYQKKQLITVSNEITTHVKTIFNLRKVNTIYNAFEIPLNFKNDSVCLNNYILFYGRIDNQSKNLFFLIDAYKKSILPHQNINLLILGDGPDLHAVKKYTDQHNLEKNIIFKPFNKNPFNIVKNALFTTMTSHYEGFPMTIVESLALGVPVVSLNFKSGPSEILKTGQNGILVDSNNTEDFSKALDKMITNNDFYKNCKLKASKSVKKFKKEYISREWVKIIENACETNHY